MPGLYKNSKRKRPTLNSSCTNDDSVWHSTVLNQTTDVDSGDVSPEEETMISPVKRPALGEGVRICTPHHDNDSSESAGPSSNSIIRTPSAAINVVFEDDGDQDMFQEMEIDQREGHDRSSSSREPNPAPPHTQVDKSIHMSQRFGPVEIHPPSGHTFFSTIIQQNGFLLTLPKNHLFNDVSMFRNNMNKWMISNTDENSRIEDGASKFLKAMKKYFGIKANLVHACTTTLNDRECIQPSLLACLLGVELLQRPLLEVVLPGLSEATFSNAQEDIDFVSTIVNQMKWLPVLVDGKAFAADLLNILEAASIPAKKHIIRLLPEIFMPDHHPDLVLKLMEIFDLGLRINVTMLDCFSCLVVPEEECMRIRRSAVVQMASAPLEDLPAYISFLFRVGCPLSQLEEGIREMREKLEIRPKYSIPKQSDSDVLMVEILERIRFFVSVNPTIIRVWLSQLKDDLTVELDIPAIDLLMLLIFAETTNKAALSSLAVVFSRPNLAIALFDKMMENNNQMLHELFPTIARFLDSVLRMKSSKCHDAAAEITKNLFVGLGPVLSQHLTSNLIGVLINGHPTCRDVVLKIFASIAEIDAPKLLYFHSYLMGALVYVHKYPPRQMQALMNVLACLAYTTENLQGEENSFTAEFMILLRKQITHGNIRTRCFGVLGTIAAVKQLALHSNEANDDKIDGLLALAWSSIENDEEACSIFFDEMISCIQLLPKKVCIQFREILKMQFLRLWTMDSASDSPMLKSGRGQADLQLAPTFDANKEMQRGELIIVLEQQALQMSPLVVPSLMRVMAELEKASENGQLEGIDILIGCPIFFPKYSVYYEQDALDNLNYNQRFHLGQYLIITLNYFRECVSAFVETDNTELRIKVFMRLNNIVVLQKSLVKHYQSFPNLPSAYGTEKNMTDLASGPGFSGSLLLQARKPTVTKKKPTKNKVSKKKRKKKHCSEEDEDVNDVTLESDEDVHIVVDKDDLEERIQPKFLFPYLRRLDAKVFSLLIRSPLKPVGEPVDYTGILLNLSNATQSTDTMKQIEQFNPETLALLLSEMKRQVMDKKCDFKILLVENLLASLCQHIDTISEFYSSQENKDSDNEGTVLAQNPAIASCLRLLFNMLNLYFETVSKQDKFKQSKLVDDIIVTISSRYKSDNDRQDEEMDEAASQTELLIKVSKYLASFAMFVRSTDYETALEHVKLIKMVHDLLPRPEPIKKAMGRTVKCYLRRTWKLPSSAITSFLKSWFSVTSSPMKVVEHLTEKLFVSDNGAIPNNNVYQTCNKTNFQTWYSTIFAGLAQYMFKAGRRRGDFDDSIQRWTDGNKLFKILVQVSNKIKKSSILVPLLKFSRLYIEAFVSGGICLMPELWKRDFEEGQTFTKVLQNSTRKIQAICEHSKVVKDNILLCHVPPMKKTLETLIFKVREAIGSKGIASAFWMGSLKHRNLDGDIISSQPFNQSDEDDSGDEAGNENSEEEMVADENAEEDDDIEVLMDSDEAE